MSREALQDGPWVPMPEREMRRLLSEEQKREWEMLQEWLALPVEWERLPDTASGLPRLRAVRKCPAEWLESEEGREKVLRLCEVLGKDPFNAYPAATGNEEAAA